MADDFDEFSTAADEVFAPATPTSEVQQNLIGDFDAFSEPHTQPSFADKFVTFNKAATGGAIKGATTAGGAVMGAKVGAAAGALTGPAAPVAVPALGVVGATIGAVAGYTAGDAIEDGLARVQLPGGQTFVFENIESVPMNLRPYAIAGDTFGGSVPFAGLPYIASQTGVKFADNIAGRVLNGIIHNAETAPTWFAITEAQVALSAAAGGGFAEAVAPGSTPARITGELAGGFLNPTRWVTAGSISTVKMIKNYFTSKSLGAQETEAGKFLRGVLTAHGEDYEAINRALKEADPVLTGIPLTAGQKTGSPALLALESKLANVSSEFGADAKHKAENSLSFMRGMITLLSKTGDPADLRMAAQVRQQYFDTLLSTRAKTAEDDLLRAMSEVDPNKATSRTKFGQDASAILEESMGEVRKIEHELWEAVDKTVPVEAGQTVKEFDKIKLTRLPEEKLPPIVEGFINRMTASMEKGEASNVGEMVLFRSRMLALSREAAAKNEWSDASVYGRLAEAALSDLTAQVDPTTGGAMDAARAWSLKLHETFSQTFAGNALRRTDEGGTRLPPELVMQRALGAGREQGALQFRQFQEAAVMAGQEHLSRMMKVQEDTLRFAANEIIIDGRVNAGRLANFRRRNKELLDQFPDLQKQLGTVEGAQRFFDSTQSSVKQAQRAIKQSASFAKILGGEDPSIAIGKMIEGANPLTDLNALGKLATRSGPDAVAGAESAVFAYIMKKATAADGDFSFAAYKQTLDSSPTPSGMPLKDILVNSGLVPQNRINQTMKVLDRAAKIEDAMRRHEPLDKLIKEEGPIFDLVARIMGSKLGSHVSAVTGGQGLVIAGASVRTVRQVFDKIPKAKVLDLVLKASRDPEMMALLLERAPDPKRRYQIALQMNSFLWQMGVGGWDEDN